MPTRQPRSLPSLVLMTDERMGEALWRAIAALPRGSAVIVRHYSLPHRERRILFDRVRAMARRRGFLVVLAGSPRLAVAWGADGAHGRSPHRRAARPLLRTSPAHDRTQLIAARRRGADLILVSPIHATRSHPGAPELGLLRAGLMAGGRRDGIVGLGGMTRRRARALRMLGITRWAAIDGLSR